MSHNFDSFGFPPLFCFHFLAESFGFACVSRCCDLIGHVLFLVANGLRELIRVLARREGTLENTDGTWVEVAQYVMFATKCSYVI